jgi:cystathionine gamma-synthase
MLEFETRAVHVGQEPDPATGAVVPPISLSTTFAQREVGVPVGPYDYSRAGNPTRDGLERQIASLESARHGFAFASGLAAIDTVLRLLSPGDHVLFPHDAYGGIYRLLDSIYRPAGLLADSVDVSDPRAVEVAWRPNTRLVLVETPSNPTLSIVDVRAVAEIGRSRGGLVFVDNTFATPYLQRPLELGADVVVHSMTKYLGGHSDVLGGFVALHDDELAERIRFRQNAIGAVLSPFDAFLTARGGEDTRGAAGARERHRRAARPTAHRASRGHQGPLPGRARSPRPRHRQAPDDPVRRDAVVRPGRRPGLRRAAGHPHAGVHSRRVAGSGGIAHRALDSLCVS